MTAEYNFVVDTGTISADTTDLKSDVEQEYKKALGQNINLASSTPQGTLVEVETVARTSVMKNNAEVANMINPNLAKGTWLDSVCAFLGVTRSRSISTVADGVLLGGDPNTLIPAGSQMKTDAGDIFYTLQDYTIDSSRVAVASIASVEYGPIPISIGNLSIMVNITGWSNATVVASTNISLGTLKSSDGQLKTRRNMQLYKQGRGVSQAILANLLDVPNVTSAQVIENNTGVVQKVNGVDFTLPNAVWVCVAGAADSQDVADALYAARNGGCPWDYGQTGNGVPVADPDGVSVLDQYANKSYKVKYTTPVMYDTYVRISCVRAQSSASIEGIQNSIVDYANGNVSGELGFTVGESVSAFELAGSVARSFPGLYTSYCAVALVLKGGPSPLPEDYVTEYPMLPYEQAQLQVGNVIVELT